MPTSHITMRMFMDYEPGDSYYNDGTPIYDACNEPGWVYPEDVLEVKPAAVQQTPIHTAPIVAVQPVTQTVACFWDDSTQPLCGKCYDCRRHWS